MAAMSILSITPSSFLIHVAVSHQFPPPLPSSSRGFRATAVTKKQGNIPPSLESLKPHNPSHIGYCNPSTITRKPHPREIDRHYLIYPTPSDAQNDSPKQLWTGNSQPPALFGRLKNTKNTQVTIRKDIMPQLSFVTLDVFGKCSNFSFARERMCSETFAITG